MNTDAMGSGRDDSDAGAGAARRRNRWVLLVLAVCVGLVAGVLGASLLKPPEDEAEKTARSSRTLVVAVRNLARLETAQMQLEKVLDLRDRQSRLWGALEAEDALLLIASASVVAGIDLSHVAPEDIVVDATGKSVQLRVPRSEIFSVALNNDRTYVYSRSTELLARRNEQLETRARQQAEELLQRSAEESQILELADRNAELVLRSILTTLGFSHVEIVREPLPLPRQ